MHSSGRSRLGWRSEGSSGFLGKGKKKLNREGKKDKMPLLKKGKVELIGTLPWGAGLG